MPTAESIRVFLAIPIPQSVSSILQQQLSPLMASMEKNKLRWIPRRNWHITVKFIGDLQTHQIAALIRELTNELKKSPAFQLELTAIDWFPSNTKPVMLVTIPAHCEPLSQLAAQMDETLIRYHISRNNRPFRAHLSLARSHKGVKPTSSQLLPLQLTPIVLSVSHIDLYQSQLNKQSVCYSKLASFKLMT